LTFIPCPYFRFSEVFGIIPMAEIAKWCAHEFENATVTPFGFVAH